LWDEMGGINGGAVFLEMYKVEAQKNFGWVGGWSSWWCGVTVLQFWKWLERMDLRQGSCRLVIAIERKTTRPSRVISERREKELKISIKVEDEGLSVTLRSGVSDVRREKGENANLGDGSGVLGDERLG